MAYAKAPDRHLHVCSPSCRDGCPPLFKELASLLSSRSDRLRRQLSEHFTHVDIMQLAINEIERCRLMVEALEAKLQKLQHAAEVQKQYPPRRVHSNITTVASPNAQIEPTLSIGRNWFYASDAGLALIRLSDLRIIDCNTSFVSTQYFEGPAPSSREQAIGTVWIQGMPPRRIARALDAVSRLIVAEDGVLHIPHLTVVDHHNRIRQLKSITLFLSNDGKTPADEHASHPSFLVQVVHAAQNIPLIEGTDHGAPTIQVEEETEDPRLSEHQAIFISTNPEKKQKKSPTQNNSPQSDPIPHPSTSASSAIGSLPVTSSSHTSPPFLPATAHPIDSNSAPNFAPPAPVVPLLPVPPLPPRASRGNHRTEHGSMLNHIGLLSASPASLYQWMTNAASTLPAPYASGHRHEDIRAVLTPDSNSSTDS